MPHTLRRVLLAAVCMGAAAAAPTRAQEPTPDDKRIVIRNPRLGAAVRPMSLDLDVRDLPMVPDWQPGDPIKEIPRRSYPPKAAPAAAPRETGADPLLEVQGRAPQRDSRVFGTPILNFDAQNFTGVNPPDTVGDVGPNHY